MTSREGLRSGLGGKEKISDTETHKKIGKQKITTPLTPTASTSGTPPNLSTTAALTNKLATTTTLASALKNSDLDMDKLIKSITDDIVNRITTEIKDMRTDFLQQLNSIENNLSDHINEANAAMDALKVRVKTLETRLKSHLTISEEVADLQRRCDLHERREVSADAVLLGIPELQNENIASIFNNICNAIQCDPSPPQAIFRIKKENNNSLHSSPIVLKFRTPNERNKVLKCIANFHKMKRRQLNLTDIGFNVQGKDNRSKNNVYLHASLTPTNRSYFRQAMRLKQNGSLFSVFTRSGLIFAKKSADSESTLINTNAILNALTTEATTNEHNEEAHL